MSAMPEPKPQPPGAGQPAPLPYKIACLCYLFDAQGRLLLLRRAQNPNMGMYSPIGGKLHMNDGESPAACARREIHEEVQLDLPPDQIRLAGIVSETAYQNQTHWLMFLYEVTRPVAITRMEFSEGVLEWHDWASIESLRIPDTDRLVIYPLFRKHRGGFFHVHINCLPDGGYDWRVEQTIG